ncbi:MAG: Malate/L-lactate dehydrogenase [Pseudonocardiales bacterium]|nr:Malate/L-lactate dehydrogenase [Pseudonocardiales bacterium]MDT7664942.1 Malate/L-lactate dehydrogenase [Pseudonocardiales bacterium]
MKVSTATLHQGVREALVTIGAPENEAAIGAEMCVDAELRGHSSHGVRLLRNIAAAYERGADRRRAMRVVDESPVSARLDGGFHLSWFVHSPLKRSPPGRAKRRARSCWSARSTLTT